MSDKTPSKVERAKAPIKTTLTLKYSHITVTIDMDNAYGQVLGFEIAGNLIKKCKPFMPKIKFNKSVVCPKCHQESTLSMVDNIGVKCVFCNADLRGEIET